MTKQRSRYVVALICFSILLTFLYTELRHHNSGLHMGSIVRPTMKDTGVKLQFPASFPKEVSKRNLIKNSPAFKASGFRYSSLIKPKKTPKPSVKGSKLWGTSMLRVFGFGTHIGLDLDRCRETLVSNSTLSVSPKRNLNTSLTKLVARIIREIDRGRDAYLREFKPYLDPQIRLQIQFGVVDKHWFNMAGSSVYLKEYGYHLMVSRLAYSPDGSRNNPKFSFAYAQLYDTKWNEVNDVGLIVPTTMEEGDRFFTANGQAYTVAHYPAILHVPFYHDYEEDEMKYLGPEDARVVLVKNEAGHEEPLLIYNSQHQKQILLDDDEDDHILKQMTFFRSIFVSWPWQFQKGKFAIEDIPNPQFDDRIYNKVKELEIKNSKRQKMQKNWTPFVSEGSRAEFGFDKHLFFVYRWAQLQILKCDFTSESGKCGFVYTVQENLKVTSSIGPLRGGTPMVSLNSIISDASGTALSELLPEGREIWVGFARAHLYKCGCGKDFYRPNLVVLLKDTVTDGKDSYRLSHISSFTSLDVDIIPWDPLRPLDVCQGTNAVIPNGISDWTARSIKNGGGTWQVDDVLSLALSVSDCTVDVIHIQGLLNTLMNLPDQLLFSPPSVGSEGLETTLANMKKANSEEVSATNDNIACAMEESTKFCAFYGLNAAERLKGANTFDDEFDLTPFDENLEMYRIAVGEALY